MYDLKDMNEQLHSIRTDPNDEYLANILQIYFHTLFYPQRSWTGFESRKVGRFAWSLRKKVSRDESNLGDRVPKYHAEMIACIFTVI